VREKRAERVSLSPEKSREEESEDSRLVDEDLVSKEKFVICLALLETYQRVTDE